MKTVQHFTIHNNTFLSIEIPDEKDKSNSLVEPTQRLHMTDEISMTFENDSKIWFIAINAADIILMSCQEAFQSALNNSSIVPDTMNIGEVGYHYNLSIMDEKLPLFDYPHTSICFGIWTSVWMYNKNNNIYLEISPNYPDLFTQEGEESRSQDSFETFIKTYHPIFVKQIAPEQVHAWLNQCNDLLAVMDTTVS